MTVPVPGWDADGTASPTPPGSPGITPRWTSSAKSGVGTALARNSRVWFTLSHGIINEVYYPRIDCAATRDLGLIVTDGKDFLSEEKRDADHQIAALAEGVPAFRLLNTCVRGRYRIEKEVLADPRRDVVLQRVRFVAGDGAIGDYRLFALLAPHLGNGGAGNTAWLGEYKGIPMLFAQRGGDALALACSAQWRAGSAGYVGTSDGWQDLQQHRVLTWHHPRAADGNVALVGEIDLETVGGEFVLALGFGRGAAEAAHRARASLQDGFELARADCIASWRGWQSELDDFGGADASTAHLFRTSAGVLKTHQSKRFPGAFIASLSIPWGASRGDDDMGGYHLVWPRDLVEIAGGLLAVGAHDEAVAVLRHLEATQEADGSWPQNMWIDGRPYWSGVQMDETAFPILLVDLAARSGALDDALEARFWPMVRRAAGFLARNGPVTGQDRWEEDPGYSPFTMAVEIAALLVAAELGARRGDLGLATYLRDTADAFEGLIDRTTYVRDTQLARAQGVTGYYVRIAAPDTLTVASPRLGFVPIKNRPPGEDRAPADELVSADALALVRFGLRAADDPRILGTLTVVDALLAVDVPAGRLWRRYNHDGYGEHDDGRPFDGTGVGRPWPLLAGERAHFELAAGRAETANAIRRSLEVIAGASGLLAEQVWDGEDILGKELHRGGASGSAMPLAWAHAEYLKLCRSLADGRVFDAPPQPAARYLVETPPRGRALWRFNHRCRGIEAGRQLRLELLEAATVRWSADAWVGTHDTPTADSGLGVHFCDLPTGSLSPGSRMQFTFQWVGSGRWEGQDFEVEIESAPH